MCHALYGLKQSPCTRYHRCRSIVRQIGLHLSAYDSALFICHVTFGMIILLLYVDDMIITSSNFVANSKVKEHIFREIGMKDLGPLCMRCYVELEVDSLPKGYLLSQYIR